MRHMVNGRLVEVRRGPGGGVSSDAIRQAAGIPADRPLVLQLPDGRNRIINPGENLTIPEDQHFRDIPPHIRGSHDWPPSLASLLGRIDFDPTDNDHGNDNDDGDYDYDDDDDDYDLGDDGGDGDDDGDDALTRHLKRLSDHYPLWLDDDYQYVIVQDVRLPPGYNYEQINFLIEIPSDYPLSPPGIGDNRIYTHCGLRFLGCELNDLHGTSHPKYPVSDRDRWAWFCYEEIRWSPLRDDLTGFMEMVRGNLTNPRLK